jgi:hypothetical protein
MASSRRGRDSQSSGAPPMSEPPGDGALGGVQGPLPDHPTRFRTHASQPPGLGDQLKPTQTPDRIADVLPFSRSGAEQLVANSDELLFRRLLAEWQANRRPTSSPTELAIRPEYQRIIGMGQRALPFILAELKRAPDHWFWALAAITGADPVPPESKGDIRAMTRAWIEWGRLSDVRTTRVVR